MKRAVAISGDSTIAIEGRKISLESKGTCYGWKRKARSKVEGACTVEFLRRRFPILKWLPNYNWNFAVYDVIAGITVGLTTIPQGIAYAAVAGLPLQVFVSFILFYRGIWFLSRKIRSIRSMGSTRLSWVYSSM